MPFFGTFLMNAVTMSMFGDRRLAARSGRLGAPWTGSNASRSQTTAAIPADRAIHLAVQAITDIGGRKVVLVDQWEGVCGRLDRIEPDQHSRVAGVAT